MKHLWGTPCSKCTSSHLETQPPKAEHLMWNQKADSVLEKWTYLELFRSLCTQFFHTRGVRIIQEQPSKQLKYTSDKTLWSVAHTTTQGENEVSLYPFSRHQHYSEHYPLENSETRASYRAPEKSTQLNKDQGAPAGIPATSLSEAETAEQWHVEKRRKNCTSPSKNPNTEVLMWQKESDRCSQQFASTARLPAQPLHLPSSAGPRLHLLLRK